VWCGVVCAPIPSRKNKPKKEHPQNKHYLAAAATSSSSYLSMVSQHRYYDVARISQMNKRKNER